MMLNHFRPLWPYVRLLLPCAAGAYRTSILCIFYADFVIAVLWRELAWLPTGLLVVSIRPVFAIEVVPFWVGRCGGLLEQ